MTYFAGKSRILANNTASAVERKNEMKKLLAILLVVALCFSMTGCMFVARRVIGDTEVENPESAEDKGGLNLGGNKYEKYDALIEAIEANDFERAYNELVKFANEAEGVSMPTQDEQYAELAKNAVGEWITFDEDVTDATALVINEDGTGTYGEDSFTWAVDYGSDESFSIKCLVNGIEFKYYISFTKYEDERVWRCQTFLVEVQDEYSWTTTHEDEDTYFSRYNKDVLEIIDITAENFNDYFEVRPEFFWNENEFGEAEGWGRSAYVFLKPEYAERLAMDDTEIKFQYTGKLVYYYCDVDLENRKVEIGDAISGRDKEDVDETSSFRMYPSYEDRFPEEYAIYSIWMYAGNGYFGGDMHDFVTEFEDFNIERAAGQLILTK